MLLQVKDLKTYLKNGDKTVKAVDGVSFNIERGETFCLVGESGSGKSVTALSVIQLLPQEVSFHPGGEILFDYRHDDGRIENVDMLTLPEARKQSIRGSRIAMIFQEPMTSLNPVFTVGDQVIEALQQHHPQMSYKEARARTIEAFRQVRIPNAEQRVDEYPHRLSGGQRQRIMIAMAMACEPDLLIADEPTTALDVTVQAEILLLMKDLQKRCGTSILFISHDFGVVSQMADRLAVMYQGKMVECGRLREVLKNPQHTYTRQLLAALPENLPKVAKQRAVDCDKDVLLDVTNLKVHFPLKKGVLRHTVDHIRAVDRVDLKIPEGQILALVGESGCGKTTLGRALLRLIEPTEGEISFAGKSIGSLSRKQMRPFRRQMQIIFQDPMSSLNPRLTIGSTLTEPMKVHGIGSSQKERLEIARKTLQQVQLDPEYIWRYPHEFSGGQRQRIGIARALVLEPRFIVCDEITSALDVSVQADILKLLLDIRQQRNLTLLFITHNIGVVEYVSDEMAVMYKGRIVEQGPTAEVCRQPQHEYTRKLLSAVPRLEI